MLGSLHATEHTQIAVLPLLAMCDRWDIGGLSTNVHLQTGRPTIFIYDGHPGGVGITRRGYEEFERLVADAARLVGECPCEDGCPSCVQSPKCGNLNDHLHKAGSIELMTRMLGRDFEGINAAPASMARARRRAGSRGVGLGRACRGRCSLHVDALWQHARRGRPRGADRDDQEECVDAALSERGEAPGRPGRRRGPGIDATVPVFGRDNAEAAAGSGQPQQRAAHEGVEGRMRERPHRPGGGESRGLKGIVGATGQAFRTASRTASLMSAGAQGDGVSEIISSPVLLVVGAAPPSPISSGLG